VERAHVAAHDMSMYLHTNCIRFNLLDGAFSSLYLPDVSFCSAPAFGMQKNSKTITIKASTDKREVAEGLKAMPICKTNVAIPPPPPVILTVSALFELPMRALRYK